LYLVKWKDFPDEANTWERRKDISAELVNKFEALYRGNHAGVELLDKRIQNGKVDYLVGWKGRPEAESSWEKESTISCERIGNSRRAGQKTKWSFEMGSEIALEKGRNLEYSFPFLVYMKPPPQFQWIALCLKPESHGGQQHQPLVQSSSSPSVICCPMVKISVSRTDGGVGIGTAADRIP
jgi:hypothetical protein